MRDMGILHQFVRGMTRIENFKAKKCQNDDDPNLSAKRSHGRNITFFFAIFKLKFSMHPLPVPPANDFHHPLQVLLHSPASLQQPTHPMLCFIELSVPPSLSEHRRKFFGCVLKIDLRVMSELHHIDSRIAPKKTTYFGNEIWGGSRWEIHPNSDPPGGRFWGGGVFSFWVRRLLYPRPLGS
jgi:hypothetical protein